MSLLIFCDEFGNTGGKLLDLEQPVLVYAFLVIEPSALDTVGTHVRALCEVGGGSPSELKSSQILRSRTGRRRFGAIGQSIGLSGAHICLSIVEKRYQVCSLIKDTYLDPFEQDSVPDIFGIGRFAQDFADACYDTLEDDRLAEFLDVVERDDAQGIADVGRRISASLRFHPSEFVSRAASYMETRPEKVFRRSRRRDALPQNAHIPASQYAAFHPGLERVEAYLQSMGQTGKLLRDHDAHFGKLLDFAYEIGRQLDQHPGSENYGAHLQLDSIESCMSASSSEQLGIQLADLAAGLIGRIARDVCRKTAPGAETLDILKQWSGTLLAMELHYVMVSDAKLEHLAPAIFGRPYS
jgi:hypothetical protein